jgi:hypothetical protein
MSKIKSMKQLREKVLQAIDDLESGKIEMSEAFAIAKMSETIVSGLRSEMQYAILTNNKPEIEFYGKMSGKPLDSSSKDIKKIGGI